MLTETQLDARLAQWSKEYGQGGLPSDRGWNIIQTLIDHEGFVPSTRGYIPVPIHTAADEVEAAVMEMQNSRTNPGECNPYYRAAIVLRVEHLTPNHWPEQERLQRLEKIGLRMSRHTYYRALQFARAFLCGFLEKRRRKGKLTNPETTPEAVA